MAFADSGDAFKLVISLIIIQGFVIVILNGVSVITLFYKWRNQFIKRRNRVMPDKLIKTSLCVANFTTGAAIVVEFICFAAGEKVTSKKVKVLASVILFTLVASLMHIILLSLERFVYLRFPFKHMELKSRTVVILLVIAWLLSIPPTCAILIERKNALNIIAILLLITNVFLIFSSVYIITVTKKVLSQKQSNRILDVHDNSENKHLEKQITKCWCATVVCYLLFTIPPICVLIYRQGNAMTAYNESKKTDCVLLIIILMKAIVDPILFILVSHFSKWKFCCCANETYNDTDPNLKTMDTMTLSTNSNLPYCLKWWILKKKNLIQRIKYLTVYD